MYIDRAIENITAKARIFLPSMGNIVFLCVFIPIIFSGKSHILLGDTDTGYHIRAGELILEKQSVPKYDPFSFHSPPLPWTVHEWLSEVIMALIHGAFGLTGIVVFFALMISGTYCLLFRILQIHHRNLILNMFLVLLVIASSTLHWLARPHIFSLIFILVYQYILDRHEYHHRKYLYILIPLMLVWVNLHGGFIVGLLLIGVYLAGNFIKYALSSQTERRAVGDRILALVFIFLGCCAASLINPQGYHILTFPLNLVSDSSVMDYVSEFQSPNFHGTLPFRYLLFLTIAILALSGSRLDITELILVILFTHMALYSARYIPLFAVVVSPILTKCAQDWLRATKSTLGEYLNRKAANLERVDSSIVGYLWPTGAIVLTIVAVASDKIYFRFDEKVNPVAAVEFLKRENLHGNMFNDDTFGDYVIYAAWPQYKVFIDGRTDMYGGPRIREYVKTIRIDPNWQKLLEKHAVNWVFQPTNSPLSILLLEREDWGLIYSDKVANIFVRSTQENQALIDKFKDVKPAPRNGNT